MFGAAAAGLGVHQRGELLDRVEGVHVTGGVRITHRVAVVVELGLGEQAGELDLAGACPPVLALAGPIERGGGHDRHTGAVDGDVELVRQRRRREHHHGGAQDRSGRSFQFRGGGLAVGLGGTFDPFGGQPDPGQVS